jgi:hypothetical protein
MNCKKCGKSTNRLYKDKCRSCYDSDIYQTKKVKTQVVQKELSSDIAENIYDYVDSQLPLELDPDKRSTHVGQISKFIAHQKTQGRSVTFDVYKKYLNWLNDVYSHQFPHWQWAFKHVVSNKIFPLFWKTPQIQSTIKIDEATFYQQLKTLREQCPFCHPIQSKDPFPSNLNRSDCLCGEWVNESHNLYKQTGKMELPSKLVEMVNKANAEKAKIEADKIMRLNQKLDEIGKYYLTWTPSERRVYPLLNFVEKAFYLCEVPMPKKTIGEARLIRLMNAGNPLSTALWLHLEELQD